MKYILLTLFSSLVITNCCLPQSLEERIVGGNLSCRFTKADDLLWGNLFSVLLRADFEMFIVSQAPLFIRPIQQTENNPSRDHKFFYGINITTYVYARHDDFANMNDFSIGPYILSKYYLPFDFYISAGVGIELERTVIWPDFQIKPNLVYTPKTMQYGLGYKISAGYSIDLNNAILLEPMITFKKLKKKLKINDDDEIQSIPEKSFYLSIGFSYLIND